jgi:hypothetical protein
MIKSKLVYTIGLLNRIWQLGGWQLLFGNNDHHHQGNDSGSVFQLRTLVVVRNATDRCRRHARRWHFWVEVWFDFFLTILSFQMSAEPKYYGNIISFWIINGTFLRIQMFDNCLKLYLKCLLKGISDTNEWIKTIWQSRNSSFSGL